MDLVTMHSFESMSTARHLQKMDEDVKNRISHRRKAFDKMLIFLETLIVEEDVQYLIDGYNLLFHVNEDVNPLSESRLEIIETLAKKVAHTKLRASVIFDSNYEQAALFPTRYYHNCFRNHLLSTRSSAQISIFWKSSSG